MGALKKPNSKRSLLFERLWVRRTVVDADEVGHPEVCCLKGFG